MNEAPQETNDWVLATLGRLPPFLVDTTSSLRPDAQTRLQKWQAPLGFR